VCNAQVRSLARERLALIVALACNSLVHTHRPIIVPHSRSSYKASCVHPRSGWRTPCIHIVAHACTALSLIVHHDCSRSQASCVLHAQARERLAYVLRSSLLIVAHAIENALRVLRSRRKYAPLLENALRSSQLMPATALRARSSSLLLATAMCTLIVPHRRSSYIPFKHRAFIHA
jgi:hypothetical protein